MDIERVFEPVISKSVFVTEDVLRNMQIFKMAQGSNFLLTREESQRIIEIINGYGGEKMDDYSLGDLVKDTGIDEKVISNWINIINRKKQIVFYGPPGTGKTFIAQKLAKYLTNQNGYKEIIQFHPAYAYEDFIEGIRPILRPDGRWYYEMRKGRLLTFCGEAKKRAGLSILIIDEINRANLSRVFGELMYLMEYRNESISLAGGSQFSIPDNVRIIGTMNTADRSIALVDHALRRRFAFIKLYPDYELLKNFHNQTSFNTDGLINTIENINKEIMDSNYSIGISFFLRTDIAETIEDIWKMEIEPYLEEFFFDDQRRVD